MGDGWQEVKVGEDRVRWRKKPGEWARPSSALELEYWNESRREWRKARSSGARPWFALGFEAGRRAQKR